MAESGERVEGIKALYRMIAYIRDEAVRLRIMDVALLLEHAEEAVLAFAPSALTEGRGGYQFREMTALKH